MPSPGATTPDSDARASWIGRGVALVGERRDEVLDMVGRVDELCPTDPSLLELPSTDQVLDYPTAHAALTRSWDLLTAAVGAALRDGAAGARTAAEAVRYVTLLGEIKQLDQALLVERIQHRDAAFARVRDALAMLRTADSTAALVEQASEATCSLGFDRSILSRIEESAWIPENVWVNTDRQWAREILDAGRSNPQVLDRTLVETEMVRRKVSILVHNVQDRPAVNRPIADASRSRSYAAAPLIADAGVVGFVHADCYYQRRELDEFDRRVLSAFAEGLGHALGRTSMMDRLAAIRDGFDRVAGALASAEDDRVWTGAGARVPAVGRPTPLRGRAGPDEHFPPGAATATLTRRELEVLRLMAAGETNGRIARRLVISEGTVKSHVKHILRKLGAANRAEAVSRWLSTEHERGPAVVPAPGRPWAARS